MYVSIEIRYSDILGQWSWETTVGKAEAYGYEWDYSNAEEQAREAARRMGGDI